MLTPMAMDSSRPFPLIRNKTLNIGALISKKEDKKTKEGKKGEAPGIWNLPRVQVPAVLPRFVQLPAGEDGAHS